MPQLNTRTLTAPAKPMGGIAQYLAIARLDHSTKHVFIVPGIVLAYVLRDVRTDDVLLQVVLGLLTAVCIASANYVINEWLDRDIDRHHPTNAHSSGPAPPPTRNVQSGHERLPPSR